MGNFYKSGLLTITPQYNGAGWDYWAHYDATAQSYFHGTEIQQAQEYLKTREIGKHPFFAYAAQKPEALKMWAAQEVRITNLFSQVMFALLANTQNVNMRSLLLPVVIGEHSKVEWNGHAERSHPRLLAELCRKVGVYLGVKDLKIDGKDTPNMDYPMTPAADKFFAAMTGSIERIGYALGFLGIGTEEMIGEEYPAAEAAFKAAFGDDFDTSFFQANIGEDEQHAQIMRQAAKYLSKNEMQDYLAGAKAGVDARYEYYTELLNFCLQRDLIPMPVVAPVVK